MRLVVADSSALVKLYADEVGADTVRGVDAFVVSALARVEVPAALMRKVRAGALAAATAGVLLREFEADWRGSGGRPRFAAVPATAEVLEDAARHAAVHGLRAYDAVQLASAIAARTADDALQEFACFDSDLRAAAVREGFRLLPAA